MAARTLSPTPSPSHLGRRAALGTLPAGGASAAGITAGAAAAVAGSAHSAAHPDAELLALCAEYVAFETDYCRAGRHTYEMHFDNPEWQRVHALQCSMVPRLHELEEEIAPIPARTIEGLKAKALVALHQLSGDYDAGEGMSEDDENFLGWTVCRDLVGGASVSTLCARSPTPRHRPPPSSRSSRSGVS